jgi:hypothetical protein
MFQRPQKRKMSDGESALGVSFLRRQPAACRQAMRRPSRWQREKSTADRRGHDRAERPGPRPKARPVSRGTKPSARLLRVVGSEGGSAQILYRSSLLLSKLTGMPEFLEA